MRPPIAVIALGDDDRDGLMEHLRALGFSPRACASLVGARRDPVVVCVRDRADVHLLAGLAAYGARARHRVVVITSAPALVRQLAAAEGNEEVEVLVPPLLLGELGDALRSSPERAP